MQRFLDRERELCGLLERYRTDTAQLMVVYGRRRVGKSALLREFCRGKAHVYYQASQVREPDNLEQFRQALALARPDALLDSLRFHSWDSALAYLARISQQERFVVVLDEFPYLCHGNPALPSILQRWWDGAARDTRLFVVLCGSQLAFMERELLAEQSPLFGRRSGQQLLRPLLPWDAAAFFPEYPVRDRLAAYAVLGGIPAYLERFHPDQDLRTNLLREALNPQGFLFDEVPFLLRSELTEIATYLSLLKAVAGGATRLSEIAGRAGLAVTAVSRYLGTLRELGLIRREVPFREQNPEKSKKGLYRIEDPFLAFWCRFILPYQSLIQAGHGETVWREFIRPGLDTYLGPVFEEVCRTYVRHRWAEEHGGVPLRVGSEWTGEFDLDVLAELARERGAGGKPGEEAQQCGLLAGECKAWKGSAGLNLLDPLRSRAARLRPGGRLRLAIFSLSGFTTSLTEAATKEGVTLVDGERILGRR